MALTPFTTADEVRAILGTNTDELPDRVCDLPIYLMGLLREIRKISESLPASFSSIAGKVEGDRSPVETALFEATRLFSAYVAAKQVGVSLASMLPKSVSDGKAAVSRFADAPYKETLRRIDDALAAARAALIATLEELGMDTAGPRSPPVAFVAVKRGYDPVAGEA